MTIHHKQLLDKIRAAVGLSLVQQLLICAVCIVGTMLFAVLVLLWIRVVQLNLDVRRPFQSVVLNFRTLLKNIMGHAGRWTGNRTT